MTDFQVKLNRQNANFILSGDWHKISAWPAVLRHAKDRIIHRINSSVLHPLSPDAVQRIIYVGSLSPAATILKGVTSGDKTNKNKRLNPWREGLRRMLAISCAGGLMASYSEYLRHRHLTTAASLLSAGCNQHINRNFWHIVYTTGLLVGLLVGWLVGCGLTELSHKHGDIMP